ncbi:hypothetical protein Y1Q_0000318 [Alligator mississippiensis]|uniref:Uncharacterized protein n=1 Tax=Alligator mississippiensis TaxID=8496 RepID=A0A151LZA0_ALLMI|nr:hypothetical protein Y1Q_0000318 [Alligator mississippiensis]
MLYSFNQPYPIVIFKSIAAASSLSREKELVKKAEKVQEKAVEKADPPPALDSCIVHTTVHVFRSQPKFDAYVLEKEQYDLQRTFRKDHLP